MRNGQNGVLPHCHFLDLASARWIHVVCEMRLIQLTHYFAEMPRKRSILKVAEKISYLPPIVHVVASQSAVTVIRNPQAHTPVPPFVCARCTRTGINTFLRLLLSKLGCGVYSGKHCIQVNTEEISHVWQQLLAQEMTRKIKHNRKLGNSRGLNAPDTSRLTF